MLKKILFLFISITVLSCSLTVNSTDNIPPSTQHSQSSISFINGGFVRGDYVLGCNYDGKLTLTYDAINTLFDRARISTDINGYTDIEFFENKTITRENGVITINAKVPGHNITINQKIYADKDNIVFHIKTTGEWPGTINRCSYSFPIPVSIFRNKTYRIDGNESFTFPQDKHSSYLIKSNFTHLACATDDDKYNLIFESPSNMILMDGRHWNDTNYYLDIELIQNNDIIFTLQIPDYEISLSEPAVRISQVGYQTNGVKNAILEWDARSNKPDDQVYLIRKGERSIIKQGSFEGIYTLFQYNYAVFDFTDIDEPGEYKLVWSQGGTKYFTIGPDVLDKVWTDTLDTYIPWQMCHADVDVGDSDLNHPKSFMDDGIRVPANEQLQNFISYESEGTAYEANDPIPCNKGGWFDAGDYQLNLGGEAYTVIMLAHTFDEFNITRDLATTDFENQSFTTNAPNGVPDIIEQVKWGVYWLLSMQQSDGRVYNGVISQKGSYYQEGLPHEKTDNIPGTGDERHVYVDYAPIDQLKFVIACAAASNVLRDYDKALSAECLNSAKKALEYFKTAPEVYRALCNYPWEFNDEGRDQSLLSALIELYLTTEDDTYLDEIKILAGKLTNFTGYWPAPQESIRMGYIYCYPYLARLYAAIDDESLKSKLKNACVKEITRKQYNLNDTAWCFNENKFGGFGNNNTLIYTVYDLYHMSKIGPDLIDNKKLFNMTYWVLGMHPFNDYVFVTDIGYEGPKHLYSGQLAYRDGDLPNRVPGAIVPGFIKSGSNLIYNDAPKYYNCNESTTDVTAAYIFVINALANNK